MEISMMHQLVIALYALIVGAALGVLYDAVRISRILIGNSYIKNKKIRTDEHSAESRWNVFNEIRLPLIGSRTDRLSRRKRCGRLPFFFKNLYIFIGDVFFFTSAGVAVTVFIYHANNGRIRWYLLLGAVAGFAVYYFTVGKLMMFFSEVIVFVLRSACAYALYAVLTPLKLILYGMARLLRTGYRITAGYVIRRHRILKCEKYTSHQLALVRQLAEFENIGM